MAEIISKTGTTVPDDAISDAGLNQDVGWAVILVNNSTKRTIDINAKNGSDWTSGSNEKSFGPGQAWYAVCLHKNHNPVGDHSMWDTIWCGIPGYEGRNSHFAIYVKAQRNIWETKWQYRVGWSPDDPGNPSDPPNFPFMNENVAIQVYEPQDRTYGKLIITFNGDYYG